MNCSSSSNNIIGNAESEENSGKNLICLELVGKSGKEGKILELFLLFFGSYKNIWENFEHKFNFSLNFSLT